MTLPAECGVDVIKHLLCRPVRKIALLKERDFRRTRRKHASWLRRLTIKSP